MRVEMQVTPTRDGCRATCRRCGHVAEANRVQPDGEVLGKRALATLAGENMCESCPRGEFNRYVPREVPEGIELFWLHGQQRLPAWLASRRVMTLAGPAKESVRLIICPTSPAAFGAAQDLVIQLITNSYPYASIGAEIEPITPPLPSFIELKPQERHE
jgi:hypothetical protein